MFLCTLLRTMAAFVGLSSRLYPLARLFLFRLLVNDCQIHCSRETHSCSLGKPWLTPWFIIAFWSVGSGLAMVITIHARMPTSEMVKPPKIFKYKKIDVSVKSCPRVGGELGTSPEGRQTQPCCLASGVCADAGGLRWKQVKYARGLHSMNAKIWLVCKHSGSGFHCWEAHDPEHSQGEQTPACHQWFGLEGVGPNLPSACRGVACWQRVTLLSYYAVLMWHSTFNLLGDALCKNWEIGETTYVMSWFKRSMRSCIVMCMFHLHIVFSDQNRIRPA